MAKVIESASISRHTAEAMIIGSLSDFSPADAEWIKKHHEGIEATLAELAAEPEWTMGKVLPMEYQDRTEDDIMKHFPRKVIFVQVCKNGVPTYEGVRNCIRKIADNQDKIGAKHLAMGRLGCLEKGGLHIGALEPVVAAAEGGKVMVDIYRGEGS